VSGGDGLCRVLDVASWERPALAGGFRSYYGGLDCCAWAADGRYLLVRLPTRPDPLYFKRLGVSVCESLIPRLTGRADRPF
jgi:hypothetical protein